MSERFTVITTDRDVFVGAHLTKEQKEQFRDEAARRKMSMSALIASILEQWLATSRDEPVEVKRSNKRGLVAVDEKTGVSIQFVKDSFQRVMQPLPSIPGHIHSIGADGWPTCGCVIHMTSIVCDKYTRPDGVMGGPCLTCGASQPEHIEAALAKEQDVPLPFVPDERD